MDFAVDLASTSSLHIHASGALSFLACGEALADWDDDAAVLAIAA